MIIAKTHQQSPRPKLILQAGKSLKKYYTCYNADRWRLFKLRTILIWRHLCRIINRFFFLIKLNRKLKEFDAKANLFKESVEGDVLEIKIGNEFCHTGIAYYSKYFFDYTVKEVMMKKLKDDNDTGIKVDYRR